MNLDIDYGPGTVRVSLPESTLVVRPGEIYHEPEPADPVAATRRALADPLGLPPIRDLVRAGSRVAIAFPDRVKGGTHPLAHRRVALRAVLDQLQQAGVADEDIRLVCAIGLHRKNTWTEMSEYLPADVLARHRSRIANHDAEDPDGIVDLGRSALGDVVTFNRTCAEADLTVVLGHVQGNPYGGFSGGHKSFTTGLTTWRSIAAHHAPATMARPDFLPLSPRSHFRSQLAAIGRRIEEGIGRRLFILDAVTGQGAQVLGVFAGTVDQVERASWPLAEQRTNVVLDEESVDAVVFGLPRDFHYGPGMGQNPILVAQAIAATITRVAGILRRGGVAIVAAECGGAFNEEWFPSYRETFERWAGFCSVEEMRDVVEDMSTRPAYVDAYRRSHGYHPFHAFSMLSMAEIGRSYTSRIFVVGAVVPGDVRAMGMEPVATVEEALRRAESYVGPRPRVMALPRFLRSVPPHLFARGG
jgi:nickel-dependent lactate racemase